MPVRLVPNSLDVARPMMFATKDAPRETCVMFRLIIGYISNSPIVTAVRTLRFTLALLQSRRSGDVANQFLAGDLDALGRT